MKRTELKNLFKDSSAYGEKQVVVCGWAKTIRDSKSFGFIELND
jgi:asparaginyl-tRNA synthetase